jgi:hypothetical protein
MGSIQEPQFPQFTNLELTGALGTGLMDQLMGTVKHHLHVEYKAQRITGKDYATVVAQSIGQVLQTSSGYLLGIALLDEQKEESRARTKLTEKQIEEVDAKLALIELEREKLRFQIDKLFPLEVLKTEAEIANLQKQGELIDKQIEKLDADMAHLLAQQSLWTKQEQQIDKQIESAGFQDLLVQAQTDKVEEEVLLIREKTKTEKANTDSTVGDSGSLVGRQRTLLAAQKLGFSGDLFMKAAKMHADYDSTYLSVLEPTEDAEVLGNTATIFGNNAAGVATQIENL